MEMKKKFGAHHIYITITSSHRRLNNFAGDLYGALVSWFVLYATRRDYSAARRCCFWMDEQVNNQILTNDTAGSRGLAVEEDEPLMVGLHDSGDGTPATRNEFPSLDWTEGNPSEIDGAEIPTERSPLNEVLHD
uniref:Uncharacterized protein n=1 Tax=Oryza punctata TaxID=4537 RepID=A0A0E0K6W3_ORYPU